MVVFDRDVLKSLLLDFFRQDKWFGINAVSQINTITICVDENYCPIPKKIISDVISGNPQLFSYSPDIVEGEFFDCDDFALQLKATVTSNLRLRGLLNKKVVYPPAIGFILDQYHAINFFISQKKQDDLVVNIIDTSKPNAKPVENAVDAKDLFNTMPMRLIYV